MRELVYGTLEFIGQPKENPYKHGEMQVGLKFKFGANGSSFEEWVNVKPESEMAMTAEKGKQYPFVKEWSQKKKDKETGKEGAYAYRPIKLNGDVPAPKNDPVSAPEESAEDVLKFYRWLKKPLSQGAKSPMNRLLTILEKDTVISKDQKIWCGKQFVHLGKILTGYAALEQAEKGYEG